MSVHISPSPVDDSRSLWTLVGLITAATPQTVSESLWKAAVSGALRRILTAVISLVSLQEEKFTCRALWSKERTTMAVEVSHACKSPHNCAHFNYWLICPSNLWQVKPQKWPKTHLVKWTLICVLRKNYTVISDDRLHTIMYCCEVVYQLRIVFSHSS